MRTIAKEFTAGGGDWRSAIDALRPHTQRLWRSMSTAQKRRFLRHGRPYWDILRHRMAPEVETRIKALRAAGKLEIVAGRIVHGEKCKDGIAVQVVRRGRGQVEDRNFARLIDCTGPGDDPYHSDNPLIGALLARGAACSDPLGIGLDISEEYALIDRSSRSSSLFSYSSAVFLHRPAAQIPIFHWAPGFVASRCCRPAEILLPSDRDRQPGRAGDGLFLPKLVGLSVGR